jgi:hypothetical protein
VVELNELEEVFALGHETRSFEVKGPGELSDKAYVARVARAAIAMGNLRDGGLVCLGVDDKQLTGMLPGLTAEQLAVWSDFDNVSDALARYSDPPVSFGLNTHKLSSGAEVVVLEVAAFDNVPHICKREYPSILRRGAIYVRPRGKPESVPIPSSSEMRELLELAMDKGVREFVRRAGAVGLPLTGLRSAEELDEQAFAAEVEAAWADESTVVRKILRSGHTDVAVHPGTHDPELLSPARLESFIAENTVRLRGWPVPYVDPRNPIRRHGSWIGQDIEPSVVPHTEAWRLCASGQFLHRRVLATDLRDVPELSATAEGATGAVAVWDVLLYCVEIAEFGARMAAGLGVKSVVFDIALADIEGRELISGEWRRELLGPYIVAADRLPVREVVDSADLLANPRGTGVQLSQRLLEQFGLHVADHILFDQQAEVFDRR